MGHYVKFLYECVRADIGPFDELPVVNACRTKLRDLRLIGIDSNGTGFGNLSVRDRGTHDFYITGSATGGLPNLTLADLVRVVAYDFQKNWLR